MKPALRDFFDVQLEIVLGEFPESIHDLLAKVPLHVEDYPPQSVLNEVGVARRDDLCGLYTGVPLSHRHASEPPILPDVVTVYREGILKLAVGRQGNLREDELRRQIRITVLHELGHHHGLEEEDLQRLGYG